MAQVKQLPQTKVVETFDITSKTTKKDIEGKIGRTLGSPINGRNEGDTFIITLTGKVEIRDWNGQKGAYYTSNEGYSVRVNSSFDPAKHKTGTIMNCICKVLPADKEAGRDRDIKFAAFLED